MGNCFGASIPPRYVTKPTRKTQPCILQESLDRVPALIGWGKSSNVTFARWYRQQCVIPYGMWVPGEACLRTAILSLLTYFTYFWRAHQCDQYTDKQTDSRTTQSATSAAKGHIYCCVLVMRANNAKWCKHLLFAEQQVQHPQQLKHTFFSSRLHQARVIHHQVRIDLPRQHINQSINLHLLMARQNAGQQYTKYCTQH